MRAFVWREQEKKVFWKVFLEKKLIFFPFQINHQKKTHTHNW